MSYTQQMGKWKKEWMAVARVMRNGLSGGDFELMACMARSIEAHEDVRCECTRWKEWQVQRP